MIVFNVGFVLVAKTVDWLPYFCALFVGVNVAFVNCSPRNLIVCLAHATRSGPKAKPTWVNRARAELSQGPCLAEFELWPKRGS